MNPSNCDVGQDNWPAIEIFSAGVVRDRERATLRFEYAWRGGEDLFRKRYFADIPVHLEENGFRMDTCAFCYHDLAGTRADKRHATDASGYF